MATFSQGIEDGIHNFFTIRGRMSRSSYWWFFLFCYLIVLGLALLIILAGGMQDMGSLRFINFLADIVFYYLMIVPGIRRLHDIDKGGENALWILLPVIGWLYMIYLFCHPSDPENNYWGYKPFY